MGGRRQGFIKAEERDSAGFADSRSSEKRKHREESPGVECAPEESARHVGAAPRATAAPCVQRVTNEFLTVCGVPDAFGGNYKGTG